MAVAQKYPEFSPIVKVLMEQTDKQHVPSARLIWRDRLFHAALWMHGHRREAITLQCINGAFEAFDTNRLTWTFRCYLRERARCACYALLGREHYDVHKLASSHDKSCSGESFECNVLMRLLSNIDALEQTVGRLGTWIVERLLGTDDLENLFSELTRRCGGYMPNVQVMLRMAKTAERAARSLWDMDIVQDVSNKRRYPIMELNKRSEWNDGQHCPKFWPLEVNAFAASNSEPAQPDNKQMRLGVSATKDRLVAVRQQHKQAAQAKSNAARV